MLEILDVDGGAGDDAELEARQQRDRHEVPCWVKTRCVSTIGSRYMVGPVVTSIVDPSAGALDRFDSDQPVAAGAVLDNDVAIEQWAEMLSINLWQQRVIAAAGRERIDDPGQRPGLASASA